MLADEDKQVTINIVNLLQEQREREAAIKKAKETKGTSHKKMPKATELANNLLVLAAAIVGPSRTWESFYNAETFLDSILCVESHRRAYCDNSSSQIAYVEKSDG